MHLHKDEPLIRIAGLTKHYGHLTAVNGLNLGIYQGEIFGFLGPNGAGKSTSIHMICGLMRPDAGEIHIGGILAEYTGRYRKNIGFCPQDLIFWPKLTCLEQLEFMGQMYDMSQQQARHSGHRLLEQLGLSARSHALAGTLSGGMKRRLNLCLALVHDPGIVVLDEPEAGLDPQSRILVRDFIRGLRKDKTVILTTHNMDEADRISDRVAIIDNGRLLVTDTPENLKKTAGAGDVLEIVLHNNHGQDLNEAASILKETTPHVALNGDTLLVRERNAIEKIPEITSKLKAASFMISEIKMRTNTLEDVFIQLTGKHLREL